MEYVTFILLLMAMVMIGAILFAIKTWRESNLYQKVVLIVAAVIILLILIL